MVSSDQWCRGSDGVAGPVVYSHRSLITYQEMMWLARKLNCKLMNVYVAVFYIDEWNDLSPLHLDVLMKIHQDASIIARLCNKPIMHKNMSLRERESFQIRQRARGRRRRSGRLPCGGHARVAAQPALSQAIVA